MNYLGELFSLAGRVALVTGGSSGIGRSMALALGRAGAHVVVVARRPDALGETVAELRTHGVEAAAISADLGDRAEVVRAAEDAAAVFGEPDILVTAAAVNHRPPIEEISADDWDATLALNLTAPFLLGQRFGPGMAARGWGRIIHVASQQAVRAYLNSGAYGVSKGGVTALTRSQAEAWSARGVCCNAVAPGVVRTPLTAPVFADEAKAEAMAARTMVGRNGEPEDYAGVAVFLASDAAAYVTGQTLFVDGGFSVH
ncbi:SDR family NAD(P)-dependent oxidoreductase [Cryptosporangium aurantiacum]|uniref:Gluconate 5-dehydrogenase n=1 Tax=Cryptosporangium aurantiacum TaxID=134849 RepID=A0A1M7RIC8_9ACTN|nr:SDR family oxidoreductase [Cryptosporangium aurantiacum]SHN46055.1 gluconate 5-dehydrogenase [Cryptosporangium aurantiacum]